MAESVEFLKNPERLPAVDDWQIRVPVTGQVGPSRVNYNDARVRTLSHQGEMEPNGSATVELDGQTNKLEKAARVLILQTS